MTVSSKPAPAAPDAATDLPEDRPQVLVEYDTDDASYSTFTRALRLDGIFLETSEPFSEGESLMMTITDPATQKTLMLSGIIMGRKAKDIEVVGELDGMRGMEDALSSLEPDVVLLDLELGDIDGVDALRQVREMAPNLKVIVYTSHDEEEYIIQAAELGVNGYLLKGSPKEEIVGAVRSVNEGGSAIESK